MPGGLGIERILANNLEFLNTTAGARRLDPTPNTLFTSDDLNNLNGKYTIIVTSTDSSGNLFQVRRPSNAYYTHASSLGLSQAEARTYIGKIMPFNSAYTDLTGQIGFGGQSQE